MDPESQSFLLDSEERPSKPDGHCLDMGSLEESPKVRLSTGGRVVLYMLLLILYTTGIVLILQFNMSGCAESFSKVPHAIDNFDVTHVPKTIDLRAPSSFFEQPTDNTTDEAWLELLAPANIRVTAAELARNNRNSVELPGGGYLAWLGVYHEIHCLNLLRKWKYRSHYFPDITPEREDLLQFHTDHCLDRIRATLMCSPDTSSLVTFDWRKAQKPVVNATKTLHSCVDWKHVIESTRSRSVSSAEMKSLVNPNLVGRGIKK